MINTIFIINLLDSSISWQTMFQDAASPVMEGIINLHHDLMFFITFIFFFVLVVMVRTLHSFRFNLGISSSDSRLVVHGTAIEIIWTVIPSLILVVVALPSFALLYSIDEVINPALTLKCIGHQWYWSYEYSDFDNTLGSLWTPSISKILLSLLKNKSIISSFSLPLIEKSTTAHLECNGSNILFL